MFWGLLTIICIIFVILNVYNRKDNIATISCIVTVFVGFIFTAQGIVGITDYPYLVGKKAEIVALQSRIQDIRGSAYNYKDDGDLIAGSIENMNQSTNLSQYIATLAEKEAAYSRYLKRTCVYEEEFLLCFFGPGWAVSSRVHNLK